MWRSDTWPFFANRRDLLRVGRYSVEHWAAIATRWQRRASQTLASNGPPDAEELRQGIAGLLSADEASAAVDRTGGHRVDVVVESAWMPALALTQQDGWWSQSKREVLARHYLNQLFGATRAGDWEVRTDENPGAALAYAFGLDPAVRAALLEPVLACGWTASSLQPALSWGWRHFARERRQSGGNWFAWMEQDRTLICLVDRNVVTAINVGADVIGDAAQAARALDAESIRMGVVADQVRGLAAGWETLPQPNDVTVNTSLRFAAVSAPIGGTRSGNQRVAQLEAG